MTHNIKRCPFCGNNAVVAQDQRSDYESHWYWYAECTGCGARMDVGQTEQEVINKWNLRVDNTKLNEDSQLLHDMIFAGWRIELTSCGCGGHFAWLKPRESGAMEMVGCVCHNTVTAINEFKASSNEEK